MNEKTIFKNLTVGLLLCLLALSGMAQGQFPIYQGFLQSALNGNGQVVTNLNQGTAAAPSLTGPITNSGIYFTNGVFSISLWGTNDFSVGSNWFSYNSNGTPVLIVSNGFVTATNGTAFAGNGAGLTNVQGTNISLPLILITNAATATFQNLLVLTNSASATSNTQTAVAIQMGAASVQTTNNKGFYSTIASVGVSNSSYADGSLQFSITTNGTTQPLIVADAANGVTLYSGTAEFGYGVNQPILSLSGNSINLGVAGGDGIGVNIASGSLLIHGNLALYGNGGGPLQIGQNYSSEILFNTTSVSNLTAFSGTFSNGLASQASTAIINSNAVWRFTNTMGVNAALYVTCTAQTFSNYLSTGVVWQTNSAVTLNNQLIGILQPNEFIAGAATASLNVQLKPF